MNTVPSGHSRPGVPCRPGLLFSSLVGLILDCVQSGSVPTIVVPVDPVPWPGPVVPDGPAVPVSYTDGRLGATAPSPLFRVGSGAVVYPTVPLSSQALTDQDEITTSYRLPVPQADQDTVLSGQVPYMVRELQSINELDLGTTAAAADPAKAANDVRPDGLENPGKPMKNPMGFPSLSLPFIFPADFPIKLQLYE